MCYTEINKYNFLLLFLYMCSITEPRKGHCITTPQQIEENIKSLSFFFFYLNTQRKIKMYKGLLVIEKPSHIIG